MEGTVLCFTALNIFKERIKEFSGNYLEIGIWEGGSLNTLASLYPDKKFYGIDPFISDGNVFGIEEGKELINQREAVYKNISSFSNIKLFEVTSKEFFNQYGSNLASLDISTVLIDGSHHYEDVVLDLELAFKAIGNKAGLIFIDDTNIYDVQAAIDSQLDKYRDRILAEVRTDWNGYLISIGSAYKSIIFCSHASDDWYEPVGARKLKNSSRFFHPNIEMNIAGNKVLDEIRKKYPWSGWDTFNGPVSEYFAYKYDMVVHFDADCIITGTLDDILVGDFELAGVRNNNDDGQASGMGTFGNHIPGIDARWQYLNCGLVASRRPDFWREFIDRNKAELSKWGFAEQDIWNFIFWSGKYKTKVLDPPEKNVFYGIAAQRPNLYDSWRELYMKDGKLMHRQKVVKIIHHAGGHGLPKLQYQNYVKPEVKDFLDTITHD
jgi:Methyltransferase domain